MKATIFDTHGSRHGQTLSRSFIQPAISQYKFMLTFTFKLHKNSKILYDIKRQKIQNAARNEKEISNLAREQKKSGCTCPLVSIINAVKLTSRIHFLVSFLD